ASPSASTVVSTAPASPLSVDIGLGGWSDSPTTPVASPPASPIRSATASPASRAPTSPPKLKSLPRTIGSPTRRPRTSWRQNDVRTARGPYRGRTQTRLPSPSASPYAAQYAPPYARPDT